MNQPKIQFTPRYRIVTLAACAMLLVLVPSAPRAQDIGPFKGCAKTPTYQYFEKLQYEAYADSPRHWQEFLSFKNAERDPSKLNSVDKAIASRPNPLNAPKWNMKEVQRYISTEVAETPIPTCYENPYSYILLHDLESKIYIASRELTLPIHPAVYDGGYEDILLHDPETRVDNAQGVYRLPPQGMVDIGTLPTDEVNAYTFPATDGLGSIIVFNTDLFMFAYGMTKVILPTLGISTDPNTKYVKIERSPSFAQSQLAEQPDIKIDFAMTVLGFLGNGSGANPQLPQSYDAILIRLTQGTERFAAAHEYSHVVLKHRSPIAALQLSVNNGNGSDPLASSIKVLQRSWDQEFQADALGLKLSEQAIRDQDEKTADERAWEILDFKSALFFFACLELEDEAKRTRETGSAAADPSLQERAYLRAYAARQTTAEDDKKYAYLTKGTHPPPWLRLERTREELNSDIRQMHPAEDAEAMGAIADALVDNTQVVWNATASRFPAIVKAAQFLDTGQRGLSQAEASDVVALAQKNEGFAPPKFPAGCRISDANWGMTFLCNPELQQAIARFETPDESDDTLLQLYRDALRSDWELLSGAQEHWASTELSTETGTNRREAVAVLALVGTQTGLATLQGLRMVGWSPEDVDELHRAIIFATAHARDNSSILLSRTEPDKVNIGDFLCVPKGIDAYTVAQQSIPVDLVFDERQFLADYGGANLQGNFCGLALALVAQKKINGDFLNNVGDFFDGLGDRDIALKYDEAALRNHGDVGAVENSIGNILTAKGDLNTALLHYSASIKAGRNDGWPELNSAINFAKLGELDQAEALYKISLQKGAKNARSQSEYARYLNEFAWFLVSKRNADKNKVKEALAFSQLSNILVGGSNANYMDTLATCRAASGDVRGAIDTEQKALGMVSLDSDEGRSYSRRIADYKKQLH